jgi:hypothetical protein
MNKRDKNHHAEFTKHKIPIAEYGNASNNSANQSYNPYRL